MPESGRMRDPGFTCSPNFSFREELPQLRGDTHTQTFPLISFSPISGYQAVARDPGLKDGQALLTS